MRFSNNLERSEPNDVVGTHMKNLLSIITKTVLFIMLLAGCQDCTRGKTDPSEKLYGIAVRHGGIPNVGNTCYVNAVLQIIARCYPDIFSQQRNDLERCGQAIVSKITRSDRKELVTREEARAFFDALRDSYNQGKPRVEQLSSGQQEDAAQVLNFLLNQGNIQEIESYAAEMHSEETVTELIPTTGQCIMVTPVSTESSMDELVANALQGHLVANGNCGDSDDGQVMGGKKLSRENLYKLANGILPVWVSMCVQTDASVANTRRKMMTPITNPFELTIEADHLREERLYSSTLVGFIYHDNRDESIDHGHYTAYVKNKAGKWVEYNDENVLELNEAPLGKAQKAYLYFYQAK